MTEEIENDDTGLTEAAETVTEEAPDDGSMAHLYREAAAKREAEQQEADAEDQKAESDGEQEEPEAEQAAESDEPDNDDSEDYSEKPPKGRRARAEYEKRIQLEQELAQIKAQNESFKQLFDTLSQQGEQKSESESKGDDIDAYLEKRGIDPENFIDDEAKKAAYMQFKELDDIKEGSKSASQKQADIEFQNAYNQRYQSLKADERQLYEDAVVHVLQGEIAELKYANPKASDDALVQKAQENLSGALKQVYSQGTDPVAWLYGYAVNAKGFTPKKGEEPAKKSKPNTEAISKLQQKAGAPAIDVANAGAMDGGNKPKLTARQKAAFEDLQKYAV